MKTVIKWIILVTVCTAVALFAQSRKIWVDFTSQGQKYRFITNDADDYDQFELLFKINTLTNEIAIEEAKGGTPADKLLEVKRLAAKIHIRERKKDVP
jgi:hypothetical protein